MCSDWSNWFPGPGQRLANLGRQKGHLPPTSGERVKGLSTGFNVTGFCPRTVTGTHRAVGTNRIYWFSDPFPAAKGQRAYDYSKTRQWVPRTMGASGCVCMLCKGFLAGRTGDNPPPATCNFYVQQCVAINNEQREYTQFREQRHEIRSRKF